MIVVGWNNGSPSKTGAGYGIRIRREDRDKYFEKGWSYVIIELEGDTQVKIRLSDSFWKDCIELRSAEIGRWMLKQKLAPWPKNKPPKLKLEPIGNRKFRLSRI